MKNVFILMAEASDGRRWVETAYNDKDKAFAVAKTKTAESTTGTKYTVLHTPVND